MKSARQKGLTIIELIVALVVAGFIMSMLVRVMDGIITNHEGLVSRTDASLEALHLRRLLHRDLVNMSGRSLRMNNKGFSLFTSHNLLTDTPCTVQADWVIEDGVLIRRERVGSMGYAKEITLVSDILSFELRILDTGGQRWMDLQSWLLSRRSVTPEALHVSFETETMSADILERVPTIVGMRLP
jgi:prepilin-type N-terminal cleavage/methylation domain-containing protein